MDVPTCLTSRVVMAGSARGDGLEIFDMAIAWVNVGLRFF